MKVDFKKIKIQKSAYFLINIFKLLIAMIRNIIIAIGEYLSENSFYFSLIKIVYKVLVSDGGIEVFFLKNP